MIHLPVISTQLSHYTPMPVGRPLYRFLLNRVSQLHIFHDLADCLNESIGPGSAHIGRLAQPGYRLVFSMDSLVDRLVKLSPSLSSKRIKSFFKKSISIHLTDLSLLTFRDFPG